MAGMATSPAAGARRRTVRNGEVELAVVEAGDPARPTVVMVHGWPDTHRLWRGVMEQMAADFHVVAYDTRGHGASSRLASDDDFLLERYAADFRAVCDAVSPERPVHALAHDWGSVEVWEAVCSPGAEDRIASFTSISGPNIDHLGAWARDGLRSGSPGRIARVLAQGVSSLYIAYFVSPLAPRVFRRGSRAQWQGFLSRVDGHRPGPDDHADTLLEDMTNGLGIYRANVWRRLRDPQPRRTSVPVLQIVPTRDPAIRGVSVRASEAWADRLERVEVPHGHWLPLSRPDLVAVETTRFIRAVESGEPAPPPGP